MTSMIYGLVGALLFILAYAYYTVAGTFPLPGREAAVALIEFGTIIGTVLLGATLMGACLSVGPPAGPTDEASEAPKGKDSAP